MSIPDDVIEAMARGMFGQDWACGAPEVEGFRKALAAAEAKGWKLVPTSATEAMLKEAENTMGMPWDSVIPPGISYDGYLASMVYASMIVAAPSVKP